MMLTESTTAKQSSRRSGLLRLLLVLLPEPSETRRPRGVRRPESARRRGSRSKCTSSRSGRRAESSRCRLGAKRESSTGGLLLLVVVVRAKGVRVTKQSPAGGVLLLVLAPEQSSARVCRRAESARLGLLRVVLSKQASTGIRAGRAESARGRARRSEQSSGLRRPECVVGRSRTEGIRRAGVCRGTECACTARAEPSGPRIRRAESTCRARTLHSRILPALLIIHQPQLLKTGSAVRRHSRNGVEQVRRGGGRSRARRIGILLPCREVLRVRRSRLRDGRPVRSGSVRLDLVRLESVVLRGAERVRSGLGAKEGGRRSRSETHARATRWSGAAKQAAGVGRVVLLAERARRRAKHPAAGVVCRQLENNM